MHDPHDSRKGTKNIRHGSVSREHIVLYNVGTFVDRSLLAQRAADSLPPHDCLRVKASSLRALAAKRPDLFTMPSSLPSSHASMDAEESDEQARAAQRELHGDDPPPMLPDGYAKVDWHTSMQVKHFMLFTRLDRGDAQWYHGVVERKLTGHRTYTHDATFIGQSGSRGVKLNQVVYASGCWFPIEPNATSSGTSTNTMRPRASDVRRSSRLN